MSALLGPVGDRRAWVSTAGRLFLAGVFVWAGWPKFLDADGTIRSVRAFRILPEALVVPFGYALPMLELALAALLVLGLLTRWSALVTAALMVVFIGGIVAAWSRGLKIDCGCFGSATGEPVDPVGGYIRDIIRDLGFLAVALLVAWWHRGLLALDNLLLPAPEPTSTRA